MADLSQLESALVKADAAGDTEGARVLAAEIQKQRSAPKDRSIFGPGGYVSEITNAAGRNFSFGLTDKAEALAHALGPNIVFGDQSFSNAYHEGLDNARKRGQQFKEEHPVLYQAGAVPGFLGSMAMAGPTKAGAPLSPAVQAVPATLKGKIAQSAGQGGIFGGLSAYGANNDESLENTGSDVLLGTTIGAGTGGIIPPALAGVAGAAKTAGRVIEPLTEKGRAKMLARYQDELLGDAKQKVIAALQNAKELVPGSKPTAGEAIAEIPEATGLAAHQKIIAKTPGVSGQFAAREAEQEAARKAALDTVAGAPGALKRAEGSRAGQAATDYAKAFGNQIKADPTLAALSENPYFQDALPDAVKLAKANGLDLASDSDRTRFLHFVKLSLDKMLSRTGDTALANTEKNAVQSLQKDLVDFIGTNNPAYETARSNFAAASKPINEMQVGRYLSDKLVAPLENTERAASFAQAVRDAPGTIKRSTGAPRFDQLGQVLSPEKEAVVNAVLEDLQRKGAFNKLAGKTSLPGGSTLKEGQTISAPNMLSRPAMIANFIMKRVGEGADEKINRLAAEQYLDPQKLAQAMQAIPQSQRGQIVEAILQRLATRSAAAIPGGQ